MLETVCIVVASLLSLSMAIAGFPERFSPMLAKKAFCEHNTRMFCIVPEISSSVLACVH